MTCEDIELKLVDYLDGNLTDVERQNFEKHIETCEKCLDELMHSQTVLQLIDQEPMENPDESLRINFYHMLHSEIRKIRANDKTSIKMQSTSWLQSSIFRYAAAITILVSGTAIGIFIDAGFRNSSQSDELKQLQTEVFMLKKAALFTGLKDESSSYRIQAVNYADDLETPDENVIEVLINTLNHDKNVNVRMAAAYALEKFANSQPVCDSLVMSLSRQTDPILQVTLINILVSRREKNALNPIQQIITNKNTIEEVRSVAENGAKILQL
jgi:hypothetical protein